jgi:hypothetical protein
MAATLECIGIPAGSPQQLSEWLEKWNASTREMHRGGDVSHSLWRDYSGAAVGMHVKKRKMQCITPWFTSPDGATRWLVESKSPVFDPDCLDCSGADVDVYNDDGQMLTRTAVQWLFFRPYRDWLSTKRRYRIEVAAFAESADFFATDEEFVRAQKEPVLADRSWLPTGMFGDVKQGGMRARARALFAGRVTHVARRENTVSGVKFFQIRVETLPGEIDVVHPATPDLHPKRGMIALVSAWVVGRPVDPPPPPKSGWTRLFKRFS